MKVDIKGTTPVYGIIGHPIEHSLSPLFQNYFLRKQNVDGVYVPWHVLPGKLKTVLHGLHAAQVRGLNITVPYKEKMLPLVQCDDVSECIGAVNTLRRVDQGWEGTNTDWSGFLQTFQYLDVAHDCSALVFGAGGTARAAIHALVKYGVRHIKVCNRSQSHLEQLVDHISGKYDQLVLDTLPWDAMVVRGLKGKDTEFVINTTSLGLGGTMFPFECDSRPLWAMDAVYVSDGKTSFLQNMRVQEKKTDGLPMLVFQGAASFSFWHGSRPDNVPALNWLEKCLGRTITDGNMIGAIT